MATYTYDDLFGMGTPEPEQQQLPATIPFTHNGQTYQIPTAGYTSATDAIDAFLEGNNGMLEPPVATDAPNSELRVDQQGQVSDVAEPADGTPYSFDDLFGTTPSTPVEMAAPAPMEEPVTAATPDTPEIELPKPFAEETSDDPVDFGDWLLGRAATYASSTNKRAAGMLGLFADMPPGAEFALPSFGPALVGASRQADKKGIIEDLKRRGRELEKYAQERRPENKGLAFITDATDSTLNMIPSILVSMATRNPNLGLGEMGLEVFTQSYTEAKDRGLDPTESMYEAARQVVYEVGPEKAFGFFNNIPGSRGVKEWFKQVLREGASEVVTSVGQQADEVQMQGKPWQGWGEFFKRAGYEGALGLFAGGTIQGGTNAIASRQEQKARQAQLEEILAADVKNYVEQSYNLNIDQRRISPAETTLPSAEARVAAGIDGDATARPQDVEDVVPEVGDLGIPTDSANSERMDEDFARIRQEIVDELGESANMLGARDIDRLANLRADSRQAGVQQQLPLEEPTPEQQEFKLNVFDPMQEQQLPLEDMMQYDTRPKQGPSAKVTELPTRRGTVQELPKPVKEQPLEFGTDVPSERETRDEVGEIAAYADDSALAGSYAEWSKGKTKLLAEQTNKMVRDMYASGWVYSERLIEEYGINRLKQIARSKAIDAADLIEKNTYDGVLDEDAFVTDLGNELWEQRAEVPSYAARRAAALKEAFDQTTNPRIELSEDGKLSYRTVPRPAPVEEPVEPVQPVRLYRGLKEGGKPRGYPGTFYTEDLEMGQRYAKTSQSEGSVNVGEFTPKKVFDVDSVANWRKSDRSRMINTVTKFFENKGVKPEESYLLDVLKGKETDFAYPHELDTEFLKSRKYDSVRYENEGGERVASWFLLDDINTQPLGEAAVLGPATIEDAIKRRNVDEVNGALQLPNGQPITKANVDAAVKNTIEQEYGLKWNKDKLAKLKKLPKDASIEEVRALDVKDSRATTRDGLIRQVEASILDSRQYVADMRLALQTVEQQGPSAEVVPIESARKTEEPVPSTAQEAMETFRVEDQIAAQTQVTSPLIQGGAQRPLDFTQEPSIEGAVPTEQQELGLEEPVQVEEAPPPPPPPPTTPPGSGNYEGYRAARNRWESLVLTARSKELAGQPIRVTVDSNGDAISVGGRTYTNKNRDHMKRYAAIPVQYRLWVDLASVVNTTGPKVVEELWRQIGAETRGLQVSVDRMIKRIESDYRIAKGRSIDTATREESQWYHKYMNGNATRQEVMEATGVDKNFMRSLDTARHGIKELATAMLDEGVIASELVGTFEESLGSYIHATYSVNAMNTPGTEVSELVKKIPAEYRDAWVAAFQEAYNDPIRDNNLADLDKPTLVRMANLYGVPYRTSRQNPETDALEDTVVIDGVEGQVVFAQASDADLRHALSNKHVPNSEMDNFIAGTLRTVGGVNNPSRGGGDSALIRQRSLARTEEELREAGFTEKEIALNKATREMFLEVVDPVTNVGITIAKMNDMIQGHRLINNIAQLEQAGLVSRSKPEGALSTELIPSGHSLANVRIPDPNDPRKFIYAGVSGENKNDGLYVHREVANMFQHLLGLTGTPQMPGFLRKISIGGKVNLTAISARTHIRNMTTAVQLAVLRGHIPYTSNSWKASKAGLDGAFKIIARDLAPANVRFGGKNRRRTQLDIDKVFAYVSSLGVTHDSIRSGAIKELFVLEASRESADKAFQGETWVMEDGRTLEQYLSPKNDKLRRTKEAALLPVEKALTAYRLEDEAVKVYAFMIERENHARLTGQTELLDIITGKNGSPTAEQLGKLRAFDQQIASYITSVYPTYSRVFRAGRAASRNLAAADFPSFNLEMMRNSTNDYLDMRDLAMGRGRFKGVDPKQAKYALAHRVVSKMIFHASTVASLAAVAMPFGMLLGIDDEDDNVFARAVGTPPTLKEQRKALKASKNAMQGKPFSDQAVATVVADYGPSYLRNALLQIENYVPGRYVDIEVRDFNIAGSQQVALGTNVAASIEMMIANGDFKGAGDATLEGLEQFMWDYAKASVLLKTGIEVASGESEMGWRIYEDTDTVAEKTGKILAHAGKVLVPGGTIVRDVDRLERAADEGRLGAEIWAAASGRSKMRINIPNNLVSGVRRIQDTSFGMDRANKKIGELVRTNESITREEFVETYQELDQDRRNGFVRIQRQVNNARALGMSDDAILETINLYKLDLSGHTPEQVIEGEYVPWSSTAKDQAESFKPKGSSKMMPEQVIGIRDSVVDILQERLDVIDSLNGN